VYFKGERTFLRGLKSKKRQFIDEFIKIETADQVKKDKANLARIQTEEDKKYESKLCEMLEVHGAALVTRRRQLIQKNIYELEKENKKWDKEIEYFLNFIVDIPVRLKAEFAQKVDSHIKHRSSERTLPTDTLGMSGQDFEIYCEHILETQGWRVWRKGQTGDQGVDLIASYGGHRVAIQCKRYSEPVGNAAVQQIFTGMKYEECQSGIVVTTSAFTKSAIDLAGTIGIKLVHFQDLKDLRVTLKL
jgi:restriction system protein